MEDKNKTFSWKRVISIGLGTVGFISAVLTIYSVFFQEKKASLVYDIISNTNVLDINANVSKLDILYNGGSLKNNSQNLKIFYIRVKNEGNENILKDFYDLNDPIGIRVNNGKIIEMPEIIATSNHYLKNRLLIKIDHNGQILLNDLIIEPNQFYIIKILVLYKHDSNPSISSIGKIAGQSDIPILHSESSKENKGIWKELFVGNIIIQLGRLLSYGLLMTIVLIGTIISYQKLIDIINKRKKRRFVDNYQNEKGYKYNEIDDVLFNAFINNEPIDFMLREYLNDETTLQHDYKKYLDLNSTDKLFDPIMKNLIDNNILIIDEENVKVNDEVKDRFSNFQKYLKKVKASYESSITFEID